MTSDSVALGELLDLVIDHRGRTPKKLGGDFVGAGVPVISAKNVKNARLEFSNETRYVTREMWDKWMPVKLKPGDVLLTSEAPLGSVAYLNESSDYCLGQRLFALRPTESRLSPLFLFYALRSPILRQRLLARASGTTVQGIRQSELLKVEIDLPSIQQQRRIAWILGSLDDKIENNRRMVTTLDTIAAALFRHSFAKIWSNGDSPFSAIAEIVGGGTPPTNKAAYWGGDVPWASVKDLQPGPFVLGTDRSVTTTALTDTGLKLYPADTVIISARGTVGEVALLGQEMTFNQSCYGLIGDNGMGQITLFQLTRSAVDTLQNHAHGSVFSTITRSTFNSLRIDLPPQRVLNSYERTCRPIYQLIRLLMIKNITLANLRDSLLSRLISGELPVPGADDLT